MTLHVDRLLLVELIVFGPFIFGFVAIVVGCVLTDFVFKPLKKLWKKLWL